MNRILVIRGGAIGDFILTLPAIKLLRDRFPQAHIEILGYTHIIALAEKRFYADAIRSIEYGPLAAFFAKDAALPAELTDYFGSFDLIVSYLFDPDGIFQNNLKRCGIKMFIAGPSKLSGREHAALQLARPLEQFGLHLQDPCGEDLSDRTGSRVRPGFLGRLAQIRSSPFIRGAEAKQRIGRSRSGRNLVNTSSQPGRTIVGDRG